MQQQKEKHPTVAIWINAACKEKQQLLQKKIEQGPFVSSFPVRPQSTQDQHLHEAVRPTANGDWSITITTPGGAITTISHWYLQKSMLMNGTSMASLCAVGCAVALLLANCHAQQVITTIPPHIQRALENTAELTPFAVNISYNINTSSPLQ